MHISEKEKCNWIRDTFEGLQYENVPKSAKRLNLERILWAEMFGNYLEFKFNTLKRFGLEGCDSFIPGLKYCTDTL